MQAGELWKAVTVDESGFFGRLPDLLIRLDSRCAAFVDRAEVREVLGRRLPVASLEHLVDGKVWAASDPTRRSSKRQKDLADLARLIERLPRLADRIPESLQAK